MAAKPLHATARFTISGILNLIFWFMDSELGFWSSGRREAYLLFALYSTAAIVLIIMIPVLIRGDWVQRVLATVLSAFPLYVYLGTLWCQLVG